MRVFRRWIAGCSNIVWGSAQARVTDTGAEMGRRVAFAGLAGLVVSALCGGHIAETAVQAGKIED